MPSLPCVQKCIQVNPNQRPTSLEVYKLFNQRNCLISLCDILIDTNCIVCPKGKHFFCKGVCFTRVVQAECNKNFETRNQCSATTIF